VALGGSGAAPPGQLGGVGTRSTGTAWPRTGAVDRLGDRTGTTAAGRAAGTEEAEPLSADLRNKVSPPL